MIKNMVAPIWGALFLSAISFAGDFQPGLIMTNGLGEIFDPATTMIIGDEVKISTVKFILDRSLSLKMSSHSPNRLGGFRIDDGDFSSQSTIAWEFGQQINVHFLGEPGEQYFFEVKVLVGNSVVEVKNFVIEPRMLPRVDEAMPSMSADLAPLHLDMSPWHNNAGEVCLPPIKGAFACLNDSLILPPINYGAATFSSSGKGEHPIVPEGNVTLHSPISRAVPATRANRNYQILTPYEQPNSTHRTHGDGAIQFIKHEPDILHPIGFSALAKTFVNRRFSEPNILSFLSKMRRVTLSFAPEDGPLQFAVSLDLLPHCSHMENILFLQSGDVRTNNLTASGNALNFDLALSAKSPRQGQIYRLQIAVHKNSESTGQNFLVYQREILISVKAITHEQGMIKNNQLESYLTYEQDFFMLSSPSINWSNG